MEHDIIRVRLWLWSDADFFKHGILFGAAIFR